METLTSLSSVIQFFPESVLYRFDRALGGGQTGLEVAARLKHLNVSALVIERNPRIGDNVRYMICAIKY